MAVARFPRRRMVQAEQPRSLGDTLQRLALIAPDDLRAIALLARDVLRRAEVRHLQNFKYTDPTKSA